MERKTGAQRYSSQFAAKASAARVDPKARLAWQLFAMRVAATALAVVAGLALVSCVQIGATQPQSSCDQPTRSTFTQEHGQQISAVHRSRSVEIVNAEATPQASPTVCTNTNSGNKISSSVTYENAHFISDIQTALAMTPSQLKVLQVKTYTSHGKLSTPEDIVAGDAEGGLVNRYRGMIVSATVMHGTTTVNGQSKTSDKGVIAIVFEVNGEPFVGYYVADLTKNTRIGIDLEPYDQTAFGMQSSGGDTDWGLKTPTAALIKAISQHTFNPDAPLKPIYDKDGALKLTFDVGEVVDSTTINPQLRKFLDALGGPTNIKAVDVQAIYNQQKAELSADEVMPPFSFKGATEQDIEQVTAKASASYNSKWRIIGLRDAVKDFQGLDNSFDLPHAPNTVPVIPVTINGEQTTVEDDPELVQRPNSD